MSHHHYKFAQKIFKQLQGGPIGDILAQAAARLVMVWWDQQFRALTSSTTISLNIRILLRYVDDLNVKSGTVPVGATWDNISKQVVINPNPTQEQLEQPPDLRTALVVKDMANSITPMFKWTVDCPSNNQSNKIPVLDLQLWTQEEDSGTFIYYEFFRKSMANPTTIPAASAYSWTQKLITFRQEAQRIMRNTSPLLPWSVRAKHLSDFSWRLKTSGYGTGVRAKVISEGIRAQEKLEARQREFGEPANRPKGSVEDQELRRQTKLRKEWFNKNQSNMDVPYTTTMFVPPTPGSILVKELQRVERLNSQGRDWGVKFVEKRGTTVDSILSRSYPWPTHSCQDTRCFPCSTADPARPPRLSCRTPGVAYKISCLLCKQEDRECSYEGESGRNAYSRGREHLRDLANNTKTSPLVSHHLTHHGGTQPAFRMEILRVFKLALDRQIEEATRIEEEGGNPLSMNNRSEWRSTPLPQLGISQGRVAPRALPTYSQLPGAVPRPRDPHTHRARPSQDPEVALDVPEVLLGPDNRALVPEVALDVPEVLLGPNNRALVPEVAPGRFQAQDPGLGPSQPHVPGGSILQPEVNPGPRSALVPDPAPPPQRRSQRERKNR